MHCRTFTSIQGLYPLDARSKSPSGRITLNWEALGLDEKQPSTWASEDLRDKTGILVTKERRKEFICFVLFHMTKSFHLEFPHLVSPLTQRLAVSPYQVSDSLGSCHRTAAPGGASHGLHGSSVTSSFLASQLSLHLLPVLILPGALRESASSSAATAKYKRPPSAYWGRGGVALC